MIGKTLQMPGDGYVNATIEGSGNSPCVVMSNSVLTNLHIWDNQVPALSDRFRVLRYDQRGHGASSIPDGPMTFDDYGADLLAVLAAFEIERCVFVGLSMGSPTGLAAYSKAPEKFTGFVVVDGVSKSAPGREAFWAERREFARTRSMEAVAEETARNWLPGEGAENETAQMLRQMIASTPVEGFAAATHALGNYDYSPVVPTLECPFLGIFGEKDGAMPQAIRNQFGDITNSRFAEIAGAGHIPNFQKPEAFNKVLIEFLDTVQNQNSMENR